MARSSPVRSGDWDHSADRGASRKESVNYLFELYCRSETPMRKNAVRERLLALALTASPQQVPAIALLRRIGVHVALTPGGARIGLAGGATGQRLFRYG